jgi:hypothetical protein
MSAFEGKADIPSSSLGLAKNRVRGVVLLDGVYGQLDKFATWIENNPSSVSPPACVETNTINYALAQKRTSGCSLDHQSGRPTSA